MIVQTHPGIPNESSWLIRESFGSLHCLVLVSTPLVSMRDSQQGLYAALHCRCADAEIAGLEIDHTVAYQTPSSFRFLNKDLACKTASRCRLKCCVFQGKLHKAQRALFHALLRCRASVPGCTQTGHLSHKGLTCNKVATGIKHPKSHFVQ